MVGGFYQYDSVLPHKTKKCAFDQMESYKKRKETNMEREIGQKNNQRKKTELQMMKSGKFEI